MARATNIYLVTDLYEKPVAAFTVKHECATWLSRRKARVGIQYLQVCRIKDGGNSPEAAYPGFELKHEKADTWLDKA